MNGISKIRVLESVLWYSVALWNLCSFTFTAPESARPGYPVNQRYLTTTACKWKSTHFLEFAGLCQNGLNDGVSLDRIDQICQKKISCITDQALAQNNPFSFIQSYNIPHCEKIQMNQNCKTPSQIFDMWCKNVRQRCGSFKKNSSIMSFLVNPG